MRTISIIFLAFLLNACSQSHIMKGDAACNDLSFKKAVYHYEKALNSKDNAKVHSKIAAAYLRMNESVKAEEHYKLALSSNKVDAGTKLEYAKVLRVNGKAEESREWMQQYLAENPDYSAPPTIGFDSASEGRELVNHVEAPLVVERVPLEGYTNVFSAFPSKKGIYFVGEKKPALGEKVNPWNGQSFLDIYQATKIAHNEWMEPQLVAGGMNNSLHDGPLSLDESNEVVYLTRSALNSVNKRKLDKKQVNQLKIVKMEVNAAGDWKEAEALSLNEEHSSSMHPNICSDNKTLYFVSDREGGYGGNDLYMSSFDGQKWSIPVNLGPEINTAENEGFPFAAEKDTLFFASNGHKGMGGLDLFVSVFDGKKWSQPQNLKSPINTRFDDFALSRCEGGLGGYLSSNRNGKDEIFNWFINDPALFHAQNSNNPICTISRINSRNKNTEQTAATAFQVHGKVIEKNSQKPVAGVQVELKDNSNTTVAETKSDNNGEFVFNLDSDEHYLVNGIQKKVYIHGATVSTAKVEEATTFDVVLEMETLAFEKPYILNNIYYDYNKYDIRHDVIGDLENLLNFLNENPLVAIELSAHTDARGTSKYNHWLSTKRAKAAVYYLVEHGIDKSRMSYKGYGESMLINGCDDGADCTEEQHQENRRLEFKIIRIN